MRLLFFLPIFFFSLLIYAQEDSLQIERSVDTANTQKKLKVNSGKIDKDSTLGVSIKDYKIISFRGDTTYLDTTQSIKKEYKFNFLRDDDFELMPFSNMGRPYNRLGRNFESKQFFPAIGADARNLGYFEVEDIDYYHVPTPVTDLMFKTSLEQGQFLDAMLTFNTSERLNMSVAFTGFRSLGKYRFDQAEAGKFRTTFNYQNKSGRYLLRGHIAAQDLSSDENGGIENRSQFEDGEEDFLDRSRIDVLYENATSRILGKRYVFEQQYKLFRDKKDSIQNRATNLALAHKFNYETKFYQFTQQVPDSAFGIDQSPFENPIDDKARLKTLFNQLSMKFTNTYFGELSAKAGFYNYDYFFNSLLIEEDGSIVPNRLNGDEITLGGDYRNQIGKLKLEGGFNYTLSGDLSGNRFDAKASYQLNENNAIVASIRSTSKLPDFNYLLYQSDYRNFNWQNLDNFEKQNVQTLAFDFNSSWFGKLSAEYNIIDNYTFFGFDESDEAISSLATGRETAFIRPFQERNSINYLKIKYQKEFKWRRWALANTVMYQNVNQENQVLNVPELITRNSLYFSKDIFKKAMFLQTGVTFKYFTSYNMDAYHPLLGEFYRQNREEFGGYPLLDFFINAKVRQTRIFLKAEHINTIWSKEYNYYSAPNYPYRDFVIRFGLVWNFFS